jgi:hypothetical protein
MLYATLYTQYVILNTQYEIIIQNKPNLQNDEMNVTTYITKVYDNLRPYNRCKNKANQTQYWLCNSAVSAVKFVVSLLSVIFFLTPIFQNHRYKSNNPNETLIA